MLLVLLLVTALARPGIAAADLGATPPVVAPADSVHPGAAAFVAAPADSLASGTAGLESAGADTARFDPARAPEAGTVGPVDFLWVLRGALLTPASIDSLVARAEAMGVRGLLVQVVGRGDAYYRSSILPRAEAIPRRAGPDFDPLAHVIERAHDAGLEVHAWMNCMLVWSAPQRPRDPRHVINAHPEWIARLPDGRRLSQLDARAWRRFGVEGVYLTPGHPRVRAWVASIAREIAERYAVDGVHLDYIRQPDAKVGYDPTTRARFALETGVDPARFHRVPAAQRPAIDSAWVAFQREQVTAVVRGVRDSVNAVRTGVALSAAVIVDTVRAQRDNAQSWRAWVREGVLDRVYLMCYAPRVQDVMDQLVAFGRQLGVGPRTVPGIAVFNSTPAAAALKILGARALGYPLIALYSYDSLFSEPEQWSALQGRLQPPAEDRP